MKRVVKEYIEPTNEDKQELWKKAVFVFDTNVLLNLYRYSAKTRDSLLAAFENFKDRVWIPYQVAYEYMRKRCDVIYETVQRYAQFKKEIDSFTNKAIDSLRLMPNDDEISDLKRYLIKWLDGNKDRNLLILSAEDDEILDKILKIFNGKVGKQIDENELNMIKEEGKKRYEKSIPPGYKDDEKIKDQNNDNNAYGDLIIWKQIIKYAKENSVGIVYVTNDQKEDWWNIVKGKTIGPRIELRKEFFEETKQKFHMYSMKSFISTYNKIYESPIDKSAIDEVIELGKLGKKNRQFKRENNLFNLLENIARVEETAEKIQKRIQRRKKIMEDIENKYQGDDLPENIQNQYDNTREKIRELEETYYGKEKELELLKHALNDIEKNVY